MTTTSLLTKSIPNFLTNPLPKSATRSTNVSFFPLDHRQPPRVRVNCKKKNPRLDPFDNGDDPRIWSTASSILMVSKKRIRGHRITPITRTVSSNSQWYTPWKLLHRERKLEEMLLCGHWWCLRKLAVFPTIQLIKDSYPGVQIDVIANERGKQRPTR